MPKAKGFKSQSQTSPPQAHEPKPANEKEAEKAIENHVETSPNNATRKKGVQHDSFSNEGLKCKDTVIIIDSDDEEEEEEEEADSDEAVNNSIFSKEGAKREVVIVNSSSDSSSEEEGPIPDNISKVIMVNSSSDSSSEEEGPVRDNKSNILDIDPTVHFGKWLFESFKKSLKENNFWNASGSSEENIEEEQGRHVNLQSNDKSEENIEKEEGRNVNLQSNDRSEDNIEKGKGNDVNSQSNGRCEENTEKEKGKGVNSQSNDKCEENTENGKGYDVNLQSNGKCEEYIAKWKVRHVKSQSNDKCEENTGNGECNDVNSQSNDKCEENTENGKSNDVNSQSNDKCEENTEKGKGSSVNLQSNGKCEKNTEKGKGRNVNSQSNSSCDENTEKGKGNDVNLQSNGKFKENTKKAKGNDVNSQSNGRGLKRVYVSPENSTCEGEETNRTSKKKRPNEKDATKMDAQDLSKEKESSFADFEAENESSVDSASMETDGSDDSNATRSDDLDHLWRQMDLAMETINENEEVGSKDVDESRDEDICVHLSKNDDELGVVCQICGQILVPIEHIVEINWQKQRSRSNKRCYSGHKGGLTTSNTNHNRTNNTSNQEIIGTEIFIHPRHQKHIKPHQMEGFNFLIKNLTGEDPGGCILAHAPGSGKTFMLISFIQSFLARYPNLRPLIVLPKGIVPTWRKEFQIWQIEDIPLHDFYSSKAYNIFQKLEILNLWEEKKSILFLGYQQFASLMTDRSVNPTAKLIREKLLKIPGLLILDEGHNPRNNKTNILNSLLKVQTLRKVVLSGTLFHNHVSEVFNIVNLIRPKFLKSEHARPIVRRIMNRVDLAGKRVSKTFVETQFCELVEETLKKEENNRVKSGVVQDLRDLTANILHYYKGDFLDELPGLCDFTVFLNLCPKQKKMVQEICKSNQIFERNASCSLISVHPSLEEFKNKEMGTILNSINVKEGVKARFVMKILSIAVSNGEKVLIFGMYLRSLELLEKLVISKNGWAMNREVFSITGESSQTHREWAMERFNSSKDAKILFGSVKACGEGISLVGASRLVILDQHANPSVTRQVVGRAFRPGQVRKVFVYRLVASDSPEEEENAMSFRKERISKLWFEWDQYEANKKRGFELEEVDLENSEDFFFESPSLRENVKTLYKR